MRRISRQPPCGAGRVTQRCDGGESGRARHVPRRARECHATVTGRRAPPPTPAAPRTRPPPRPDTTPAARRNPPHRRRLPLYVQQSNDMAVNVTWHTDPGCPWAYSASPALAVLRWRYGAQLNWRLVTIGLAENTDRYAQFGFTPARSAQTALRFRRYGMPFATEPRSRLTATARGCRTIIATRLLDPANELAVHRALQLAWFSSTLLLDEAGDIAAALAQVPGLDVEAIVAALDDDAVSAAYEADRDEARTAEGGPTEFQGKAANSDGRVRYTAPSLIFEFDGRRLEAGGFQPIEAYDVCLANLDVSLERQAPPEDPLPALRSAPEGLVTGEVAAILAQGNEAPDRDAAESALIELAGEGLIRRHALGDDALWQAVPVRAPADAAAADAAGSAVPVG